MRLSLMIFKGKRMDFWLQERMLGFSSKVVPLARASVVYNGDAIEFSDGVRAVHYTETGSLFYPPN